MSRSGLAKQQRRVFQATEKLSDAQVLRLEETPENRKEGSGEASERDIRLIEWGDRRGQETECAEAWRWSSGLDFFLGANDSCHLPWSSTHLRPSPLRGLLSHLQQQTSQSHHFPTWSFKFFLADTSAFPWPTRPLHLTLTPFTRLNFVVHIKCHPNIMLPTHKAPTLGEPDCTSSDTETTVKQQSNVTINSDSVTSNRSSSVCRGRSLFSGTWSIYSFVVVV